MFILTPLDFTNGMYYICKLKAWSICEKNAFKKRKI